LLEKLKKVGEGSVPMTQAMNFSAANSCDVGEDSGVPVSPDYGSRGNAFNGRVKRVQLAIGEAAESLDHLVSPEEAIRIASVLFRKLRTVMGARRCSGSHHQLDL
jgi:arylsulfatase